MKKRPPPNRAETSLAFQKNMILRAKVAALDCNDIWMTQFGVKLALVHNPYRSSFLNFAGQRLGRRIMRRRLGDRSDAGVAP